MSATSRHEGEQDTLPARKPNHSFARKPKSPLQQFFWRRRMWFESTFVFSMLEPWEKVMLLTIIIVALLLLVTGLIKYMPHHILVMHSRAKYYLWGQEGDARLLRQLIGKKSSSTLRASSLHTEF